MVGARVRKFYDDQAKERQKAAGGNHSKKALPENLPEALGADARDHAGKAVGVSGKSVGRGHKKNSVENSPQSLGTTRDRIGKLFGVSGQTVDRARRVAQHAIPEVQKASGGGSTFQPRR
jgi:hypothetical protein